MGKCANCGTSLISTPEHPARDGSQCAFCEIADLRRQLEEAKDCMERDAKDIADLQGDNADLQGEVEQLQKHWAHAHRLVNDLWAFTDPEALNEQTRADIVAELDCELGGSCPLTREDRLKAEVEELRGAADFACRGLDSVLVDAELAEYRADIEACYERLRTALAQS